MNEEEHRKIASEIDKVIGDIVEEFSQSRSLFKNNERFVRTRLLLNFSLAEVTCTIFDKFYNLNLSNKDLMKKWLRQYCLTERNEVYKTHPFIKELDEHYLYSLRCSLVHAFALPEYDGNLAIMFPNGEETAENMQTIVVGFENIGKKPVLISPDSLTQLFILGAVSLHSEVFTQSPEAFEGIKRVYLEFKRRGGLSVKLR